MRLKISLQIIMIIYSCLGIASETVKHDHDNKIVTIDDCCKKAEKNYPALTRLNIIEKAKNFNLENVNKAYLPQGTLSAQASWQSDVTHIDVQLPENFPPIAIPQPEKNQYKIMAELNQLIWDGGRITARKRNIEMTAVSEIKRLEVELYALRERVYHLFFGILLLKEKLKQQNLYDKELQRHYDRIDSYMRNGLANESDLSTVRVQQLMARQQRIQLESQLEAYIKMLSVMIGDNLSPEATFIKPTHPGNMVKTKILRPELDWFNAQEETIISQFTLLNSDIKPTIAFFAQGGYGKPGLDMFNNKLSPYFAGGVRIMWNLSHIYTLKNKRRLLDLNRQTIDTQRQLFIHNLNIEIPQREIEIEKFRKTMKDDEEILHHLMMIRKAAEAKVENGTMTVSELMKEVDAEESAKQNKLLHEIEYLLSLYMLKQTTN